MPGRLVNFVIKGIGEQLGEKRRRVGAGRRTRHAAVAAHGVSLEAGRAAGGKYRLIDIPISNCINSEINQIYVLTQFQSVSLHRHIRGTYRFDNFSGGFVEILAAQQTIEEDDDKRHWYQGTADAVRKNLRHILQPGIDYVLILSGDQLYRMDFREMLATHLSGRRRRHDRRQAGPSLRSQCPRHHARGCNRPRGRLPRKAEDRERAERRRDGSGLARARGIKAEGRDCLASMGIYLFNRETLVDGAREDQLSGLRQGSLSCLDPHAARAAPRVRRLLGRHRHDPLVLRREPATRPAQPAVRTGVCHRADLHPHAFAAADAYRRR